MGVYFYHLRIQLVMGRLRWHSWKGILIIKMVTDSDRLGFIDQCAGMCLILKSPAGRKSQDLSDEFGGIVLGYISSAKKNCLL